MSLWSNNRTAISTGYGIRTNLPMRKARPLGDPDFVHPELLFLPPYANPSSNLAARLKGEGIIDDIGTDLLIKTAAEARAVKKRKPVGRGCRGGKSYNNAAIRGGDWSWVGKLLSSLTNTASGTLEKIATDTGNSVNELLADPERLKALAVDYGPKVFKIVKTIVGKIPFFKKLFRPSSSPSSKPSSKPPSKPSSNEPMSLGKIMVALKKIDTEAYDLLSDYIRHKTHSTTYTPSSSSSSTYTPQSSGRSRYEPIIFD